MLRIIAIYLSIFIFSNIAFASTKVCLVAASNGEYATLLNGQVGVDFEDSCQANNTANWTKLDWRKHFAKQSEQVRQQWGFDGFFFDNASSYPYPNRWVTEIDGVVSKAAPPVALLKGYRSGIRDMLRRVRLLTTAPIITNISAFEWTLNQCRYVTAFFSEQYIQNHPEDKTQTGVAHLC